MMDADVLDQIQGEVHISLNEDESIELSDVDGGEESGLDSKLFDTQEVITADTNQSTPDSSINCPIIQLALNQFHPKVLPL